MPIKDTSEGDPSIVSEARANSDLISLDMEKIGATAVNTGERSKIQGESQ